jgi:flagellar biosynthesis/type III secretory pathway chaperone
VQGNAQQSRLKATLEGLVALHAEEAQALRRLAREELDALTDRKLALWEELRAISAECPPGPDERALLERIRHAALQNQILLHHARDAVRTILQNASGLDLANPSHRPSAVQDGLRVNFRG